MTLRAHSTAVYRDNDTFVPAAVPPFAPGDEGNPVGVYILSGSGWQYTSAPEHTGPASTQPAGSWRATSEAIISEV